MLAEQYKHIRKYTEQLCAKLKPEDHVVQQAVFASPPKWHLGHTTWFFETFVLKEFVPGYTVCNPDYNFLFNSYYETVGERVQRDHRGGLFRPPVEDIYAYRKYVDEAMSIFLSTGVSDAAAATVTLGLQHEQQHQELLVTDTLYLFSCHPLLPVWDESMTLQKYRQSAEYRWLSLPEGVHTIGYEGDGFCFDNELGVHKQYIPAGEIMSRPVTNGEFLEFIEDGGYKNFRYWLSEGWDWVNREKIEHPLYWQKKEQDWYFYHIDGLKKLDADLPLMHVSYYEAEAFAHWKKMRLPTEFEWETAAKLYPESFRPVVWEWTQSAYLPYPGFKTAEGAIGEYNGKFMVSQMVLRGGSIATPAGHTRFTYRNFFHPHFQWQFSGIRLMK